MGEFQHLLSPLQIGSLTVRNRLVATAQVTHYAIAGADSRRDRDYFAAKAEGGVGLIIVGNRLVHPTSTQSAPRFPWGYAPELIPAQRRVCKAVHDHGAAIIAQTNHFGLNGGSDAPDDLRVLWGPSAVRTPTTGEVPKVMEPDDIAELVKWWGQTAEYMREAGFDGVEVHIAHAYLLHQFLSPIWNKRLDDYGGSFENRLRLSREVVGEVRRRVGDDFVVGIRICVDEYMPGGSTLDDAISVATALEATGQINYVNTTAGGYHQLYWAPGPSDLPAGWLVEKTARLKAALQIPVIVVGGLSDPTQAEAIIANGKADLVAMTREQIADPDFTNKLSQGREDEIVHCIRCNQACIARLFTGTPAGCTVNPVAGREGRFGILPPTAAAQQWLVIGGGPAGMKAAETLALRGHHVSLVERSEVLGGQVNLILRTPGRETFAWITEDLERRLRKFGVEIRLATEATPELVHELLPDAVIVATGARPGLSGASVFAPMADRLPGLEQAQVATPWDVLLNTRPLGHRVVVLDDDGTRYAAGTAEVLLDRGHDVEVVTPWTSLFPATAATMDQAILYARLFEKGLRFRVNSWAHEVTNDGVTVFDLYTNAKSTIPDVDAVVLATAREADEELYFALRQQHQAVYRIGDCVAPRRLDHAIYEGYLAGRELWSATDRYLLEGTLEQWDEQFHREPSGADSGDVTRERSQR